MKNLMVNSLLWFEVSGSFEKQSVREAIGCQCRCTQNCIVKFNFLWCYFTPKPPHILLFNASFIHQSNLRLSLLAVTEVNVKLAMEYFFQQEKTSQLDFRKQLAKALIYNDYMEVDSPRKRPRPATTENQEHSLETLPVNTKFCGAKIVEACSEYPQKQCSICKKKRCRTYCSCTPGEHVCKGCYGIHMVKVCGAS